MKRALFTMVVLSSLGAAQEKAPPAEPAWFEGTIVQREKVANIPKAILGNVVHTTLSANKIRRETSLQLAKLSTGKQGIIVDLDKQEATVYRTDLLQKYYCTLPLKQLAALVDRETVTDFIGGRERGYSRVFLPLLMGAYAAETTKDAVTVLDRKCDRIVVTQAIRRWRIASCPEIRVREQLVNAVYPRIPKEVNGYPLEIICEVLRGPGLQDVTIPPWLRKAFETMDKINDALSLQESTAAEISPKKVPADAFTLDGSFKKLNTLEELDAKFPERKGDFDDSVYFRYCGSFTR